MGNPVVWFEVMGNDGDKLRSFYGSMFGWEFKAPEMEMDYGTVSCDDGGIPGGIGKAPAGPGWVTFYVEVDNIEASLAKATEAGGKVIMPRTAYPGGHLAVFSDPEGHAIGLSEAAAA